MKKSDLKRLEDIVRQDEEKFSMDDDDAKEFVKAIDKYLPEHLRRFRDMTGEEIDAAVAGDDFKEKEKERFEKFYKPLCDQIYTGENESSRITEAELNSTEISDADRLMFNTNRLFPEFQKHYRNGTLGSDSEFCRRLKRLIEFGRSIGEDPMDELICRMNLK